MKVFLSHSTKDKQFVQTLADELKREQIESWLCEVDIEFGDNFVAQIEEGLRDADLAVLFWSPEAACSDWTRLEWTSVTAREISESRTRLGIVLLRDCEVPQLLRVKHRIDARTDPEKARHETLAWIKRLRDMRRLTETKAPGVFLPPPPHDFVGRAVALEELYAALVEEQGSSVAPRRAGLREVHARAQVCLANAGRVRRGRVSTLRPASRRRDRGRAGDEAQAWRRDQAARGANGAAKAWLAERRTLLVLDDIWENDVIALAPGPPASLLCTSRRRSLPWISRAHSLEVKSFSRGEAESIFRIYLGDETVEKHRDALLEFAERVERLPIAIVVGADMLRRELDPVPEAARGLRLERLRNEVHDVAALLRRAITARPEEQRRLLNAMAVCALEGFWFPLTVEIAGLTEAEGRDARNRLVDASLLRMLDRDRQRFQLHALLREELQNLAPLGELQAAHAVVLERRFVEFFTVNIRNKNTRAAYGQAAGAFLRWCEGRGIMRIEDVRPVHVAGYIEQLQASRKAPTVKQHLACIRMLFDWLVTGQVLPANPAHAVRGPRHSVIRGATAVMSSQETSEFLKSIDTTHLVGLRDRAFIGVMVYAFARVPLW